MNIANNSENLEYKNVWGTVSWDIIVADYRLTGNIVCSGHAFLDL